MELVHFPDTSEVVRRFAVDLAQTIAIGDMVFHEADDVRKAYSFTWDTDEATTRKKFCAKFAGISLDKSEATDADEVRVATEGVHELPCTSTAYECGDLFGPEKDTGNYLDSDLLEKVSDPAEAIGWAVERTTAAKTTVKVELYPAVFKGSIASLRVEDIHIGNTIVLKTVDDPAVTNWLLPYRCKIIAMKAIVDELVAADSVGPIVSYRNGSNVGDDTLTFAEADARGAVKSVAVDDANDYDMFDVDDALDIYCSTAGVDSGTETGTAHMILRVIKY